MSKKRKADHIERSSDESIDTKPAKKFKADFSCYSSDDIYAWAIEQGLARSSAQFISQQFSAAELLALTALSLQPWIKKRRISKTAAKQLLKTISTLQVTNSGQNIIDSPGSESRLIPGNGFGSGSDDEDRKNSHEGDDIRAHKTEKNIIHYGAVQYINSIWKRSLVLSRNFFVKVTRLYQNATIRGLKTPQDVRDWLKTIVTAPPSLIPPQELRPDIQIGDPHDVQVSDDIKKEVHHAAVECVSPVRFHRERIYMPLVDGTNKAKRSLFLMDTLNILRECVMDSTKYNEEKILSTKVLDPNATLLYATFGSGMELTSGDWEFFTEFNHTGAIALRILWRYYLQSTYTEINQIEISTALAKYLTLFALINRLQEVGVGYIVLPIDDMEHLYDASKDEFRRTVQSLCNVMHNKFKHLFIMFAGASDTLHPIVTLMGVPDSISVD